MRLGERGRIIVSIGPEIHARDSFRVAVRPERIQIGPVGSAAPDTGSNLEGTIAEIVYLGMYTQFHVDTPAGRVVSHRLAGETVTTLGLESRVVLSWEPEHTSVLDDVAASTASL
jgi:ABC-type Fe3+/spermidine/putrescine transport system ATPase subunit